jgi:diguanylate cyclase (GGDEF)-like protein
MNNRPPAWQNLQHPVSALIDWFMPPRANDSLQIRERVLAGYVILQSVIGIGASIAMLMSDWPWESRWQAALVTSGQSLFNLLFLYGLRAGVPRRYIINGVIGICYLTFTIAVIATGGPYATDIPLLLLLVASFAFCLGGERLGLLWSIIILLTLLVISQLSFESSVLNNFSPDNLRQLSTVVFIATLTMLGAILLVYERIYSRYGKQINMERQNYYAQAHTDPLTGLPNRRAFEIALEEKLAIARAQNQMVALVYIDLDGFKGVNDRFGHDVGDMLLQQIARRIESCLRATDRGARLGGDEFGIILSSLPDATQAHSIIERLRATLLKPVMQGNIELPFGASIGYATFPTQAHDSASLIQVADKMMYREKNAHHSLADYAI